MMLDDNSTHNNMNGVHDMGGMDGFGAIEVETNEPVFHADWERKTFATMMAIG